MKKILPLIMFFGLLFTIFLFTGLFTKSLFSDYLIKPIADQGMKISNDSITNNEIIKTINWYDNWNLPYDILFLFFWISTEISIIYFSINSNKLPAFDFSSFLFFGILIIFLAFNFISQITNWFYIQFVSNIFGDIQIPIYTFYIQNHEIIVFLNILLSLILNQLFGKIKLKEAIM